MLVEGLIEIADPAWWEDWEKYHFLELLVTVGLLFAVAFLSFEVRAMRQAADTMAAKLEAASGSFNQLLEAHYDAWGLTPTEREVARLVLKGCSNAEIAEIRNAATGTVKAQTHSIYAKSGLSGKSQLMGFLLEELTDGHSLK
ncbi:LuxR C-terminal-related transcriptional regulator (plasmid) [Leisingera sp. S132]|uniref:helix-turn-helix transcriptional regulator n=1 Tax=Leisingera sp. S132 TaxID=2867016 RepID=UPI0021A302FD|nr:LuxR family transcriptional regulator [Leisingera sp. S132]UWQ81546.1 LuxR C-terminal-related transcriptional regulator [Leisingera sp. S132]